MKISNITEIKKFGFLSGVGLFSAICFLGTGSLGAQSYTNGGAVYGAGGVEKTKVDKIKREKDEDDDDNQAFQEQGMSFNYGLGLDVSYTSNQRLASASEGETEDTSYSVSTWMGFSSAPPGMAKVILTGNYAPSYTFHSSNSSKDSFSHSASLAMKNNGGGKFTSSINSSYREGFQQDRLVGDYVKSQNISVGANAGYRLSSKTSLNLGGSYRHFSYDNNDLSESESYSGSIGMMWKASPLMQIGPSFSYGQTSSTGAGDRESFSAKVSLSYELTQKIKLNSTGGYSWSSYKDGATGDSGNLTGSLGLSYALDDIWSFSLSGGYSTNPSPDVAGSYFDNMDWSVGVSRPLGLGTISLDYSYSDSSYTGQAANGDNDSNMWTIGSSYNREILKGYADLMLDVSYSENSGRNNWSNWQTGMGISVSF